MKTVVETTFVLDQKNLEDFNAFHLLIKNAGKVILFLLMVLIIPVSMWAFSGSKEMVGLWIGGIVFVVLFPPFAFFMLRYRFRKYLMNSDAAWKSFVRTLRFDETGIFARVNKGEEMTENTLPWQDVTKSYETKGYFYFYDRSNGAYILPKTALQDEDALTLRKLMQQKLGKVFIMKV